MNSSDHQRILFIKETDLLDRFPKNKKQKMKQNNNTIYILNITWQVAILYIFILFKM